MTFPNVILIGGAPRVGKTTVARLLAARLGYSFLSTDDFGEAAEVTSAPVHQQIAEVERRHQEIWPRVTAVIDEHTAQGRTLVVEGRALCPDRVVAFKHPGMAALWLSADEGVLAARVSQGDCPTDIPHTRMLARAFWCNKCIRQQTRSHRLTVVEIPQQTDPELVCDICLSMLPANEIIDTITHDPALFNKMA